MAICATCGVEFFLTGSVCMQCYDVRETRVRESGRGMWSLPPMPLSTVYMETSHSGLEIALTRSIAEDLEYEKLLDDKLEKLGLGMADAPTPETRYDREEVL
jgi:hypothetical protein